MRAKLIFSVLSSHIQMLISEPQFKVWFLVFCCSTTGAVDVRVMEDYSTDAFILAFIRFSCRFGYPKCMLPDEGSR